MSEWSGVYYTIKRKKKGGKQSLSKGEEQKPASYIQKKAFWGAKSRQAGRRVRIDGNVEDRHEGRSDGVHRLPVPLP